MEKKLVAKLREFNRFYTNIIGVVNDHILESEYSLTEVRIMYEIQSGENVTARKIKEVLKVDEGYLSRTINKLVKQKIINRARSQQDSRNYVLSLSKKGESIFLKLNSKSSDAVLEIIHHLTAKEQNELIRIIDRFKELLTNKKD